MAQMIRKQVYIKPMQDNVLKKRSRMLGITEAEVIRMAIDTQVVFMHSGVRDLEAWEREKAFIAERYEERLSRYGR